MPTIPETLADSPTIKGEVINRNSGVNVIIGIVIERSDNLIALIYRIVATVFKLPPMINEGQNPAPKTGISIRNNKGTKNGKAKELDAQATTYSSTFSKPFLLNTSFADSKNAVKIANAYHTII